MGAFSGPVVVLSIALVGSPPVPFRLGSGSQLGRTDLPSVDAGYELNEAKWLDNGAGFLVDS